MRRAGRRIGRIICSCLCFVGALAMMGMLCRQLIQSRGHGVVILESNTFSESARKLNNPYRGFYELHGFFIMDEVMDFQEQVKERFQGKTENSLALVQINLQQFVEGEISRQGLENVDKLFQAFENVDRQLIVRFLYDWEGENARVEPEQLDIILGHMQQLEEILLRYSNRIFVVQGLFVGNWGEMNGSKFLAIEDLQTLAQQLAAVTDASTFLAVRTPAQWRSITQINNVAEVQSWEVGIPARLGLYNDGMLGNESDCGTYGNGTLKMASDDGADNDSAMEPAVLLSKWSREEELRFQEELCRKVPLGGEVILENSYNDFENAVADMATMHVTYLNGDYDAEVHQKWKNTIVTEEGCFLGMDGYSYIERHLGYRLVLRDVILEYDFWKDALKVNVAMQNVGFAPVYRETDVTLRLVRQEDGSVRSYPVEQDIRSLAGGTRAEERWMLQETLSLTGMPEGSYTLYFQATDVLSGEQILFGNEQDAEKYGYRLGEVKLESVGTIWEACLQAM